MNIARLRFSQSLGKFRIRKALMKRHSLAMPHQSQINNTPTWFDKIKSFIRVSSFDFIHNIKFWLREGFPSISIAQLQKFTSDPVIFFIYKINKHKTEVQFKEATKFVDFIRTNWRFKLLRNFFVIKYLVDNVNMEIFINNFWLNWMKRGVWVAIVDRWKFFLN